MKHLIFAILIIVASCTPEKTTSEIFVTDSKAIRGYDAVAFHTEQKALLGNHANVYEWKGAKWLFANQQNLLTFMANPEKYAPQYGGYCAYGTADGHKAPTETETWTILHGKLYFNYNKEVQQLWKKDQPGYIRKADSLWPTVKDDEF